MSTYSALIVEKARLPDTATLSRAIADHGVHLSFPSDPVAETHHTEAAKAPAKRVVSLPPQRPTRTAFDRFMVWWWLICIAGALILIWWKTG